MLPWQPLQDFFSLSKRFTNPSLPHRGSAEPRPHIPLPRDKVVLAEAPSAGMFFRPCQGRPRTVLTQGATESVCVADCYIMVNVLDFIASF